MKPPRLLSWLLLHSLDPAERTYVIGDCEEEYQTLAATHGRRQLPRNWGRYFDAFGIPGARSRLLRG